MKRIKVDIPDELYEKSMKIAQKLSITFDDFCAKGIEQLAKENLKDDKKDKPTKEKTTDEWKFEWKKIRERLNDKYELNNETENDWEGAIKIFSERLNKFYINPINELIELPEIFGGQGFVIVTAQCALIETFAAFKKGKVYKSNAEDEIYYHKSVELFKEFLESEELFRQNFGGSDKPSISNFYESVRCGLIHETRTRIKWLIKADVKKYLKKAKITEKTFVAKTGGKYIVFRNQLQAVLLDYFTQYKKELKEKGEESEKLRRLFARKLDHLFDLTKKEIGDYKWWNHENK